MKLDEFCMFTYVVEKIFVYWDKVGREVFDGTTSELLENIQAYGECKFDVYNVTCGTDLRTNEPYFQVSVSKNS